MCSRHWLGSRSSGRSAPGLWNLIYQLAEENPTHSPAMVAAANASLLHGEHDRAAAYLGRLDADQGLYSRGLWALINGDVDQAVKQYARALAAERKQQGTPKVLPRDPASVFLPLAYLLSTKKTRGQQAQRLIVQAADAGLVVAEAPWGGWDHLTALDEVLPDDGLRCVHPVAVLLEGLCTWWRGKELSPRHHETAIAAAHACDWGWIADELVCGEQGEGLGSLRAVRADWEHRLTLLSAVLQNQPAVSTSPTDARLAWTLETGRGWMSLDAREQLWRKGKWTVGRKVAYARLLGGGIPQSATPADAALIRALRVEHSRSYRGYPEVEYFWEPDVAWPALIGHPAIFDGKRRPLTIVGITPRLVSKRVKGKTVVRVEPPPSGERVRVVKIGNGYEVTVFTAEQLRIAEVVGGGFSVPAAGTAKLKDVLSSMDGVFATTTTPARAKTRPGDPRVLVRLRPVGRGVEVELVVQPAGPDGARFPPGEGSPVVLGHDDAVAVRFRRDLAEEVENMEAILALPGLADAEATGDRWRLSSPQSSLTLLEALKSEEIGVFWPDKVGFHFRKTARAADLRVTIREVRRWFHATGSLTVDEDIMLDLTALLDRILSSGDRFIKLDDGSFIALERSLQRDLEALARTSRKNRTALAVHPLASSALESLASAAQTTADEAFTRHLTQLDAIPDVHKVPTDLRTELRAYQKDAFQWLARLSHSGVGALLADDMGLGKTVISLALLLHRRQQGPILIVAPTSVGGNWMQEIRRFAPALPPHRLRDATDRAALIGNAAVGDVVICSYGLMVSEAEQLAQKRWGTVVFDESQALKNPATQRHKVAARLDAEMRIALTGTPIENHLGELHAHFAVLNPGMLGSRATFRANFQRPIEAGDHTVRRHLKALVSPYLLRRTKEQVLDELPSRTDINVPVEMGAQEAALYEAIRRKALAEIEARDETDDAIAVLAQLTRLRLLACSPRLVDPAFASEGAKLATLGALIHNLQDGGHRALVFSQFVKHLTLIRAWLEERSIRYQYLDGSTPAKKRDQQIEAFQSGDAPLFLISTQAGGQGLNLTAADYVIHMDPWWNPAVEDQATGRAHRIGQRRPVTVYRLFAQGTVEEQILALHQTKRSMADGILQGADVATRLSADQLLAMMRAGMDERT
ncbi:MAG: DEAD/DEAH box helicase [Myxococcota bacterium]